MKIHLEVNVATGVFVSRWIPAMPFAACRRLIRHEAKYKKWTLKGGMQQSPEMPDRQLSLSFHQVL